MTAVLRTSQNRSRLTDLGVQNRVPAGGRQQAFCCQCFRKWDLRGRDLNPRPLGYEPNELPDCSTPRHLNG